MRLTLALIALLLTGCFDVSVKRDTPPQPVTIVVYGDSLCWGGWPDLVTQYVMTNRCVPGYSLSANYPDTAQDRFTITVIALGVNDAGQDVDPATFELLYRQLYDSVKNPICWIPPLTDYPNIQAVMIQYQEIITRICDRYVLGVPSDHPDGIHYTAESQQLNAYNFEQFMTVEL